MFVCGFSVLLLETCPFLRLWSSPLLARNLIYVSFNKANMTFKIYLVEFCFFNIMHWFLVQFFLVSSFGSHMAIPHFGSHTSLTQCKPFRVRKYSKNPNEFALFLKSTRFIHFCLLPACAHKSISSLFLPVLGIFIWNSKKLHLFTEYSTPGKPQSFLQMVAFKSISESSISCP